MTKALIKLFIKKDKPEKKSVRNFEILILV